MSEMTAMPILAALPGATATAPLPGAHGKAGMERDSPAAAAAPGAAAGDQKDGAAPPGGAGDSFATVLGRQLAKDIADPNDLPAIITASPASAPMAATAVAADQKDTKAEEKLPSGEDGTAAGMATLLPLLQSLLSGAPAPRPDAKSETRTALSIDAKIDPQADRKGNAKPDVAGLQAEPAADDPGATVQHKPGESKSVQPQAVLGAGESNTGAKSAAAIPAASPLDAKATGSRNEPAAAPEASFANLLASAQTPAQVSRTRTPLAVEAPVGSRNWDSNVGEKLVWMVNKQEQHADLVLNPPQLGRVEVSISVNGDQASAQFVSANPAVRDALEAAMPRLREMLGDAGLNLGQAQVGSGSAQNASGDPANNRENSDNSRRGIGAAGQVGALGQLGAAGSWSRSGTGMVDVFA